jgi:hypothetical protein
MAAALAGGPPQRLRWLRLRQQLQQLQEEEAVLVALLLRERNREIQRQQRRWWVKPWIERRVLLGQYDTLMRELQRECQGDFVHYLRMEPAMFREILLRVGPRLEKSRLRRQPLEPGLKLAITLRYLVTGNSYKNLQYAFRVAHNTICMFVPEVCQALIDEYQDEVFAFPTNPDEWRDVAGKFGRIWNFHHACGALDGKHVAIRRPNKSGTLYFNYKGFFSIVILALVDADYKFMWADVGAQGSASDCQVFNHSPLLQALEDGTLHMPNPEPLPNDDTPMPYFIVGDDAFPLRTWLMKPFSNRGLTNEERIFNYRLCRARRVVENSFGILAHRFRCLLGTMQQSPERAKLCVMATMCLHNLMRLRYPVLQNMDVDANDQQGNHIPGAWRNDRVLHEMHHVAGANAANRDGKRFRVYLKHYYNSDTGRVPWQDLMI